MTSLTSSPSISPKSFPAAHSRSRPPLSSGFRQPHPKNSSPPESPFSRPQAPPSLSPASPRSAPRSQQQQPHQQPPPPLPLQAPHADRSTGVEGTTATTSIPPAASGSVKEEDHVKIVAESRDIGTQYTPPGLPPTAGPRLVGGKPLEENRLPPRRRTFGSILSTSQLGKRKEEDIADESASISSLALTSTQATSQSQVPSSRLSPPAAKTSGDARNRSSASLSSISSSSLIMQSSPKKARQDAPHAKLMPKDYSRCDSKELGVLISVMLLELIRLNDGIPLKDGVLTRFHSRAPPAISVRDYLNRIIIHATLTPPLLLAMVYYIDRLCAMYPAFTITSLTVHRFLITAATVAAKGLSDSFWTNHTYARVGGVSQKELAMLELDFLGRLEWKIIPPTEILDEYYRSLVSRTEGYELESD